jgi:hypothetical protein
MPVGWRERDWSKLRDAVAIEELRVRATLAAYGLLKFFECPLIRGTGVYPAVSYLDVESGPVLFYGAGREDCLHYGGGYIFFDWAPILGNAPTSGASVTCGHGLSDNGPKVLFQGELYVGLRREHRGDGCSSASLYSSDDCEGVWVPHDSVDQWWSAEYYGEGTGR